MIYIKEEYTKYDLYTKTVQVQDAIELFIEEVEFYKDKEDRNPSKYTFRFIENGFEFINEDEVYTEVICRLVEKE